MSSTETYCGARFHYNNIEDSYILIEDIAHSLAQQCRYNGHCSRFYSVAEHSIHVASILPPALRLFGLLHDAAEAYVGDMAKPLKDLPLNAGFKLLEQRIQRHIFNVLIGDLPGSSQRHLIHEADMDVLTTEAEVLMVSGGEGWEATEGRVGADIVMWEYGCKDAEAAFLSEYNELVGEDGDD